MVDIRRTGHSRIGGHLDRYDVVLVSLPQEDRVREASLSIDTSAVDLADIHAQN